MQAQIDAGLIPGAVTLVARQSKVCHIEAMGWKDILSDQPSRLGKNEDGTLKLELPHRAPTIRDLVTHSWRYSLGMDIEGALIERLIGQRLADCMRDRIFVALGMTTSPPSPRRTKPIGWRRSTPS